MNVRPCEHIIFQIFLSNTSIPSIINLESPSQNLVYYRYTLKPIYDVKFVKEAKHVYNSHRLLLFVFLTKIDNIIMMIIFFPDTQDMLY